ncbi:CHAD domain-containing protein [Sphingomonas profundi]|uniref:CYTH and CHAD domain-containing protein n=1 Tax=Alterirhizorhabdus profundi TaxID=2681549 RepID=UPI0012E83959|nr:CHAD domain-containing protein [Sphingomonas profundi]
MNAATETELKLSASAGAIQAVLADPDLFGGEVRTREQSSTYHDTGARALEAAGLSLRVRRIGDRRIQTVKAEGAGAASLFAREEWERDIPGDVPQLDDITIALTTALGADQPADLAPVFVTEVTRTIAERDVAGSRIELVADRGRILAGERTAAISEIELELMDGDRGALFALARRIGARAPVRLGVQSKSERGYALLRGQDAKAIRSEPIRLEEGMDAAALFEAIAFACLRHFRLNEDRLLATGRAEPLHQSRVALRRLRSALSIFRPMLADAAFERLRGELRWISGLLGEVRNIDVLIPRIDDADTAGRLRAAREDHAATLVAALDSDRMRGLMLDLAEWIVAGAWRDDPETAELRTTPATLFAGNMLDRLRRRIRKRGRDLAEQDEASRHEVRILGKKLRYAGEFFADLFPGKKAVRRRERFLDQVARLQEALGELNDLATARTLFAGLGIEGGERLLTGGKPKPPKRLLADAEAAYEGLIDEKRFWR